MSEHKQMAATPPEDLREQIMSYCVPKNEREWWAMHHIESLERQLADVREPMCAVCAGDKEAAKRINCICDGIGTQWGELEGMRGELQKTIAELESATAELTTLRQSLQRAEARRKAEVTANMVGGIQVEDGDKYAGADNLAIVLVSYFEHHMDRPEPDPDGENGWGEWAEAKARKAMQIIADEINKAREPLPASDGGVSG